MPRSSSHFRLSVGAPDGPRSSIWRIWTARAPKSDVYIAVRSLGGVLKISLHESGLWRAAFTREYALSKFANEDEVAGARLIEEWTRPAEIGPGVTLAFRIIVPAEHLDHLTMKPEDVPKIHWIDPPDPGYLLEIAILLTAAGVVVSDWPAKDSMDSKFLGKASLPNGETLWLVYLSNEITEHWYKDKDRVRDEILSTSPKLLSLPGLIRSKKPRITVGGAYPDGSRYYMDLSAKKFLGVDGYIRLLAKSALLWLKSWASDRG